MSREALGVERGDITAAQIAAADDNNLFAPIIQALIDSPDFHKVKGILHKVKPTP